jgi:hypothetical protein
MTKRIPIGRGRGLPLPRIEQLLPLACLIAAVVLFASEFMVAFEFAPPGREALADQTAGDRHGYALAVIAAFAFGATAVAVLAGSKPAAISVGVAGVIALLVILIVDLPDVGAVGTFEDARQSFFDTEAVPQAGFWLGLVAALSFAASGIALASLSADQLAALRPHRPPREDAKPTDGAAAVPTSSNSAGPEEGQPIPLRSRKAEGRPDRARQHRR